MALASTIGVADAQPIEARRTRPDAGADAGTPPPVQNLLPDDILEDRPRSRSTGFDTSKLDRNAGRTPRHLVGSVTVSDVGVSDGRSREEVAASLEQLRPQFHTCYLKALQRKSDLRGKLELRWTIDASGSVGFAKLARTSLNSNEVITCVLNKLKSWKFPRSSADRAVASGTVVLNSPGY
ncbi:MAG TPA: AgmX/PglI C-terminal domain-containing protein [Myxococcaceae bacterium]